MLPIITVTELQKRPGEVLKGIKDYAVIQSHGHDRAFVLHPSLGRVLLESGMLDMLREKAAAQPAAVEDTLTGLIGNVLKELSKR